MNAALAVLWLHLAVAWGAPSHGRVTWTKLPPPERYADMNAMDYYDVLIAGEYGKVEKVVRRVRVQVTSGDVEDMDESYAALQETLTTAKSRLEDFPPWKDETTVAEAIVAAYDTWHDIAQKERDDAFELTVQAPLSDKDVKKFEGVRKKLDADWAKSNEAVRKVIDGYAADERLVFKEKTPTDPPEPFAPELPTSGSQLAPAVWVAKAIAYHNALHSDTEKLVATLNGAAAKMNSPELQAARKEALEAIAEPLTDAKQFGSLGGEQTYRDAVVAYGEWMVGQLEGPLKEHADLTEDGAIEEEEVETLNTISDALNAGAVEHAEAVDTARQDFLKRWHVEDYLKWRKAQKKR